MHTRLRKIARRWPRLRGPGQAVYGGGRLLAARLLGRLRQDPLRPLWVDPRAIEFTIAVDEAALRGNPVGHIGSTAGGDWDLGGVPVREHDGVYAILEGRMVDGRAWLDIAAYRANLARIARGELVDGATTAEAYAARWAAIAALYARIAREGYKSQAELAAPTGRLSTASSPWSAEHALAEVRVQIGRGGELLFEEGLHRLAIAQLLGVARIPVLVTRRHAEWAALREAVLEIVGRRGFFHQPFGHPDLDCLNAWYGTELAQTAVYGHERWEFMRAAGFGVPNWEWEIKHGQVSVLDIGAYFGYFCHRFEALGFTCTAVEPDALNLDVLKRWRAMRGRRFAVREKSIFELPQGKVDIVLALNIFHHFVRTKQEYDQLAAFLEGLECRVMFFEPDSNEGIASYRHFSDEAFVDFVLAHTGLSAARLLGRASEGRNVYLLTREE